MRLIDADALIEKRSPAKVYFPDMYVIGQGFVMDAPTIEATPVVHGKWNVIGMRPVGTRLTHYCSICGGHGNDDMSYCPNCGALMGKEGE